MDLASHPATFTDSASQCIRQCVLHQQMWQVASQCKSHPPNNSEQLTSTAHQGSASHTHPLTVTEQCKSHPPNDTASNLHPLTLMDSASHTHWHWQTASHTYHPWTHEQCESQSMMGSAGRNHCCHCWTVQHPLALTMSHPLARTMSHPMVLTDNVTPTGTDR